MIARCEYILYVESASARASWLAGNVYNGLLRDIDSPVYWGIRPAFQVASRELTLDLNTRVSQFRSAFNEEAQS